MSDIISYWRYPLKAGTVIDSSDGEGCLTLLVDLSFSVTRYADGTHGVRTKYQGRVHQATAKTCQDAVLKCAFLATTSGAVR